MKKAIVVVLSLAFVASVSLAFAEELAVKPEGVREIVKEKRAVFAQAKDQWRTDRQASLEKFKQEKEKLRGEFKEKFTAERCANIEEKIQNRTAKFESAKEKHASAYTNLVNRIQKFIDQFKTFNETSTTDIDSAKIKAVEDDLATLKTMIAEFKTSYAEYFTKLGAAKKFTCGSSEGEFKASLVDARTYLKSVHTNAAEIRKFVKTEILPDVKVAKQEMAKIKGETEDEDADDDDKEEGGADN